MTNLLEKYFEIVDQQCEYGILEEFLQGVEFYCRLNQLEISINHRPSLINVNHQTALIDRPESIYFLDSNQDSWGRAQHRIKQLSTAQTVVFSNATWSSRAPGMNDRVRVLRYPIVWYDFVLSSTKCYDHNTWFKQPQSQRQVDFTCLIGRSSPQRDRFVELLQKRCSSRHYVLNYGGTELGGNLPVYDIRHRLKHWNVCENIDFGTLATQAINVGRSLSTINHAGKFSIAVETNIEDYPEYHLTEKTLRSVMLGQPFIVVSGPGFLANMRQDGFHTFGDLWDESYDHEPDTEKRLQKIVDTINYISNEFDWQANQTILDNRIMHNITNFWSKNIFVDPVTKFLSVFNELGCIDLEPDAT